MANNIDYIQIRSTARNGTGTQFQMFSGTAPAAGNVAGFDSNGNIVSLGSGVAGPPGPQGPKGDPGATGAQGPQGLPTVVQDEGTPLTSRQALNFVGAGVTATDNSVSNRTDVTIPGDTTGAILTTKGDLLTKDTALMRLPVGANNTILSANSAQTGGLQWVVKTIPVANQGNAVVNRNLLNFVGAGVTAADNAGATRTDVTIPGQTPWTSDINGGAFNLTNVSTAKLQSNSFPTLFYCNAAGTAVWHETYDSTGFQITESGVGNRVLIKPGGNVGIGTTTPNALLDVNGRVNLGSPNTAPVDANIATSQISIWVNESTNTLTFRVKYASGTLKTGTIALT